MSSFYLKESAGPISVTDELLNKNGKLRGSAILKYLLCGKGPLATTGCDHGAFVCTAGEHCSPPTFLVVSGIIILITIDFLVPMDKGRSRTHKVRSSKFLHFFQQIHSNPMASRSLLA